MLNTTPSRATPLRNTCVNTDSPNKTIAVPLASITTPQRPTPTKTGATPTAVPPTAISPAILQAAIAMATAAQQLAAQGIPSPMAPAPHHPVYECICPTCQYYRAAMMMHHHTATAAAASPMMDQYTMYQPFMFMPGMYSPAPVMPGLSPAAPASSPAGHLAVTPGSQSRSSRPSHNSQSLTNTLPHVVQNLQMTQEFSVDPQQQAQQQQTVQRNTVEQFNSISGNIRAVACTPQGRSLLQAVLRLNHADKTDAIFREVLAHTEALMLDPHGCHVVRSLIEKLETAQVAALVTRLDETLILNMSTLSQYTRRILQTLFEKHGDCDLQYIVDIMSRNARYLAATQQGCIAMMRVFEKCNEKQKQLLIETLIPMLGELACDQFGNYVVQCVLENTEPALAAEYAIRSFTGKFLKLACNKYASNAVEKLVRCSTLTVRKVILDELVYNPAALLQVAADSYGNFVVQTIIDTTASAQEHKRVCERLKNVIAQSPYGHKIETKMRAKRNASASVRHVVPTAPTPVVVSA